MIYFLIERRLNIFNFLFFGEVSIIPSSQMTMSSSIRNSWLFLFEFFRDFREKTLNIVLRLLGVCSTNGARDTVDLIEEIDSFNSGASVLTEDSKIQNH